MAQQKTTRRQKDISRLLKERSRIQKDKLRKASSDRKTGKPV